MDAFDEMIEGRIKAAKRLAYRDAAAALELEAGQSATPASQKKLLREMAARILEMSGTGTWAVLMDKQLKENVEPLMHSNP